MQLFGSLEGLFYPFWNFRRLNRKPLVVWGLFYIFPFFLKDSQALFKPHSFNFISFYLKPNVSLVIFNYVSLSFKFDLLNEVCDSNHLEFEISSFTIWGFRIGFPSFLDYWLGLSI